MIKWSLYFRWRDRRVLSLILSPCINKCKTIKRFKRRSWLSNFRMIRISSCLRITGSIITNPGMFRAIEGVTDSKILGLLLKISKKKKRRNSLLGRTGLRPHRSPKTTMNRISSRAITRLLTTTDPAPASHQGSSNGKAPSLTTPSTAKTRKASLSSE